jgi:hypothetical protein
MASAADTVIAAAIRFLDTDTAFGQHDPRAQVARQALQAAVEAATCNEDTVDITRPVLVVLEGGRRSA